MKKETDKSFENYLTRPKPARIFELNANSSMHVGYINVPENELLNYANTGGVLIKNNEYASKLDWSPFTHLILESKTRKIVYKITTAEKVNNELIFAHLLRPLDMYDLMAVMKNNSKPGDIFLETRMRVHTKFIKTVSNSSGFINMLNHFCRKLAHALSNFKIIDFNKLVNAPDKRTDAEKIKHDFDKALDKYKKGN